MTAVEIEEALKLGIQAHKAGRLQEADQYYTRILRVFPKHPDANHNMGVLAVGIGQISRSLEFFWRALESHKNVVQFWVSLIDAYIRLERYQDAVQTIEAAQKNGVEENALSALLKRIPEEYTQVSERPSLQEIQSLITLYNSGAYSEVLSQSSKLLNKYSNYFLIHNIRGAAYAAVGSYKEAIQSYEIAVQLNPKYADAYNNMGIAQQKDDDFDNAVLSYQKAIELKPDFAEAYNNLGALFNERENYAEAINILEQAVQLENTFSPLYTNLGIANKNLGKLDEAISFYQKALELSPENQNVLYNLGVAFYENGQLQKAMNCYDNALKINPLNIKILVAASKIFEAENKLLLAKQNYEKIIAVDELNFEVHLALSKMTNYYPGHPHLDHLERLIANSATEDHSLYFLELALAKAYCDTGDYRRSYEFYSLANGRKNSTVDFDSGILRDISLKLISAEAKISKIKPLKIKKPCSPIPIFILGMPRSGSTLVEQIISSHYLVASCGELNFGTSFGIEIALGDVDINKLAIENFRSDYLRAINEKSNQACFITDKMPFNFRIIPLICKAFPEAKIIHTMRDARAVTWSIFKNDFRSAALNFSYSLENIQKYFIEYKNLMAKWEINYKDRIYNLNYETLVNNQEVEIKALINWIGLDWDAACLRAHENKNHVKTASNIQVRKKIYKNSSRQWLNYSQYLQGELDEISNL
jgi:tetratricopeptide (TPR) repeat protein